MRAACFHHFSHLVADRCGVAVLEFALCLPVLLLLCLGGFDLSRLLLITLKTEKVAFSVADVVAQSPSLTSAQLNQYINAASQIMLPYPFGPNGIVIVSSVYQSAPTPPATVRWRSSGGGTLARISQIGPVSGSATLPNGLTLAVRDNVIVAEVYYRFTPVFPLGFVPATDIYRIAVYKPRLGALATPPA
jgi:Flp pilus assembly protein TadG